MADIINKSDIFKFVALRPPVPIIKKNKETNFIKDQRETENTPVGQLVKTFDKEDGTKIPDQIREFIKSNKIVNDFPENENNLFFAKIFDKATSFTLENYSTDVLKEAIFNILDIPINSFLDSSDNQLILDKIWDSYYAFYILSRSESQNLDILTKGLRTFHLLNSLKNDIVSDFDALQNVLFATPLISKLFTDLPKPIIKLEKPNEEKPNEEKQKEYKNLWTDILDTHRAISEIKNLKFDTKTSSESTVLTIPNKEASVQKKGNLTLFKSNLSINKKSLESLHSNTKTILNNFNLEEENFQIAEPLIQLQDRLGYLYFQANSIADLEFIKTAPVEAKLIQGLAPLFNKWENFSVPFNLPPVTNVRASIKPLGIGELKVVKQKLKKYVAGEVAHIENVLRGEYKERKHRVLDRTENFFAVSNETNEETTKDNQTTERFELKKESEKTIQEQMSVDAGVTVSGSYGMVTFGAYGNFAYSTATQESNKNSSNFAREVIDKSVSKIQKKTKEERTTKKLHEVEEINTHGIDNKGQPDHAVGIYCWVDKYYEAQIYNYGKRMMFEFIIPEPAAFYEYAQANKPKKNTYAIKPKELPKDFNHKMIGFDVLNPDPRRIYINHEQLVSDYHVQGVTPPPLPYKTISINLSKDSMPLDGNPHTESKQLIIPTGYISKVGVSWELSAFWSHFPIIEVIIGNKSFRPLIFPDTPEKRIKAFTDQDNGFNTVHNLSGNFNNPQIQYNWFWPETAVPITINCVDTLSYAMNVYVLVERTNENFEQWQIQTFEKIMTAYNAMQTEYEQKLAAQEVQQGIAITGQNPRINREIEKNELKKQCVKMLMDTYLFGSFDAMKDKGQNLPPDFDIFEAVNEGKTIQFFEQAFEWENLTYLFYPYFWARNSQWIHKSNIYDNDPLFTKFLQAGSSRVVIPVHPGYNDSIMYFLENNGAIWGGGEPPRLNDPLYISLADELKNQTDDLGNATPEGNPWEVVLPTTLVYLQKDADLPTFNS